MKTGIKTLMELAAEIDRRAKAKQDIVTSSKNIEAVVVDSKPHIAVKGIDGAMPINSVAHRQLQSHLSIPAPYYDRMLAEQPSLLVDNVNTWLRAKPEQRLVRCLFGDVRAYLSDRYRPLENEDLAEAALPVLLDLDLELLSSQITDTRFYLKCVDKKVSRELAKVGAYFGDHGHTIVRCCFPAITISNSEVGQGALSVLTSIFDRACSNLATFEERSTRKYHVGGKHEIGEDVYALLSDETRRKTDAALWGQVRDIVKAAFDRAKFDSLCDKIESAATDKIEGDDVVKTVSFATGKLGLTDKEGVSVLKSLMEQRDLSRFGLYNAITAASAGVEDYDRASEMERIGGRIIELSKSDWRELVAA